MAPVSVEVTSSPTRTSSVPKVFFRVMVPLGLECTLPVFVNRTAMLTGNSENTDFGFASRTSSASIPDGYAAKTETSPTSRTSPATRTSISTPTFCSTAMVPDCSVTGEKKMVPKCPPASAFSGTVRVNGTSSLSFAGTVMASAGRLIHADSENALASSPATNAGFPASPCAVKSATEGIRTRGSASPLVMAMAPVTRPPLSASNSNFGGETVILAACAGKLPTRNPAVANTVEITKYAKVLLMLGK